MLTFQNFSTSAVVMAQGWYMHVFTQYKYKKRCEADQTASTNSPKIAHCYCYLFDQP